MIPKIIHYCWFGGKPLPPDAVRCVESWRRFCPDYEIREWNEKNFDISASRYASEAYEAKKWAFVADYTRITVLRDHGGLYMDTDQEVLRNIDAFLAHPAFSATEDGVHISAGIMGAERNNPWITMIANSYQDRRFKLENGSLDMTSMPCLMTDLTLANYQYRSENVLQDLGDVVIYPSDYFYPMDHAGRMHRTDNTHAIHWFAQSWVPWHRRMLHKLKVLAYRLLPGR